MREGQQWDEQEDQTLESAASRPDASIDEDLQQAARRMLTGFVDHHPSELFGFATQLPENVFVRPAFHNSAIAFIKAFQSLLSLLPQT